MLSTSSEGIRILTVQNPKGLMSPQLHICSERGALECQGPELTNEMCLLVLTGTTI